MFHWAVLKSYQRLGQAGNGWGSAQGGQAVGIGGAVEEAEQAQGGQFSGALLAFPLEPVLVGGHDLEGVAASGFASASSSSTLSRWRMSPSWAWAR